MATVEEVCRLHDRAYVDHIKALSDDRGGDAGGLTPFGPGSYEIALLAAGGVLAAVDAVLDGTVANAFALVRPPGHHALAGEGMGFCIFGNAAIAALHLRSARGVARVAIVDWDVHHGNGTQAAFYSDPGVLTISLHQDGCFPPGSGPVEENGEGAGEGANINVPLPRGGGRGAYVAAFERVVVPALDRFKPDFLIIASGLDANAMDPLARMQMHSDGYRELADMMLGVAARNCGGRLVVEHEGGYSSAYVPFCGFAVVEQLSGIRSDVEDPMLGCSACRAATSWHRTRTPRSPAASRSSSECRPAESQLASRASSSARARGHSSSVIENIATSRRPGPSPRRECLRSTPSKVAPAAAMARRECSLRASVLSCTRVAPSASKACSSSSSLALGLTWVPRHGRPYQVCPISMRPSSGAMSR